MSRPEPLRIFHHNPLPSGIIAHVRQEYCGGYYGRFDARLLAARAATLISANSDAEKGQLIEVMTEFLTLAQTDSAAVALTTGEVTSQVSPSCWLCVRMTQPSNAWVLPRWHTDGRMFSCTCPEPKLPHSKYGFTILGPSTRVLTPSPTVAAIMAKGSETGRHWDQNEPDAELVEKLREFPQAEIHLGQIIRFSWGQDDSPVHSEPDSTGLDRVFVTILFGSEDEIKDMCEFRGEQYGCWEGTS